MLVNVYYPIYDTIMIAISVILTLVASREMDRADAGGIVAALALLTFGTSWITESVAKTHGIQLLTLSILALGIAQLLLLRHAIRQPHSGGSACHLMSDPARAAL
jgi:hypothetical protein